MTEPFLDVRVLTVGGLTDVLHVVVCSSVRLVAVVERRRRL